MKTRNKKQKQIDTNISQYSPKEQVEIIENEIIKIGIADEDLQDKLIRESLFNLILTANGARRAYLYETPITNTLLHSKKK